MNALIALAALTLSAPAHANTPEIQCHSTDVIDGGYLFTLSADRGSALLEAQTIAGPRPLAQMKCERLSVEAIPDAHQNTLLCRADKIGGGILVRLFEGGFFFHRTAQVSSYAVTAQGAIETPVQFGKLACGQEL